MEIVDLGTQPNEIREQAAALLVEQFGASWPSLTSAMEEVGHILHEGFARAGIENGLVLGWIGGLPTYNGRVWELHPLVVHREHRRRGVGRALVEAFEAEAAARGAFTVTLGTDDESGMTSLSGVDLYADLPQNLASLRDLGRNAKRVVR